MLRIDRRYRRAAFTEPGDVRAAPSMVAPLRTQTVTLELICQRNCRCGILHIRQRRIKIGFVAADVVVMVQRAGDDRSQTSGAQDSMAFTVLRHFENYGYIVHARDILQQLSALMPGQRDQRLTLRGISGVITISTVCAGYGSP